MIVIMTAYAADLLKFVLFYHGIMGKELHRYWLTVSSLLIWCGLTLFGFMPDMGISILCVDLSLFIMFWMIKERWKNKIVMLLLGGVLIDCAQEIIIVAIKLLQKILGISQSYDNITYYFISQIIVIVLLIAAIKWRKVSDRKAKHKSSVVVYIIVSFVIFMMMMVAVFLSVILDYLESNTIKQMAFVVQLAALLGIFAVAVLVYYIYHANQQLKEAYQNENILKENQRIYYESLLQKEEETRRFRHDLVGHLMCLNDLAVRDDTQGIIEYVSSLSDDVNRISQKVYNTGNHFVQMVVKNSSNQKNIEDGNVVKTSKKDKNNHGFGIKNMQDTIVNCGGRCELAYKDGMFISSIFMPVKPNL